MTYEGEAKQTTEPAAATTATEEDVHFSQTDNISRTDATVVASSDTHFLRYKNVQTRTYAVGHERIKASGGALDEAIRRSRCFLSTA